MMQPGFAIGPIELLVLVACPLLLLIVVGVAIAALSRSRNEGQSGGAGAVVAVAVIVALLLLCVCGGSGFGLFAVRSAPMPAQPVPMKDFPVERPVEIEIQPEDADQLEPVERGEPELPDDESESAPPADG